MNRDDFERFVGFGGSDLRQGVHVGALAALAGVDEDVLAAATPHRRAGSRRMMIGSAWTDLSDMAGRRLKVCAECLADDRRAAGRAGARMDVAAWCRPEWSVRSIMTCTVHDVLLTTACHACSKELDGANPAIDVCRCGATIALGRAESFDSSVDALLLALISGSTDADRFVGAGLHQVSAHLTRLGAMTFGWSDERPERNGVELLAMRDDGLRLFEEGSSLRSALDAIVTEAHSGPSGRPGITSVYGWIWRSWLGVPTDIPLDVRLHAEVLAHAAANGIRSQRKPREVTLAQAGSILRAGHERTRRLVRGAGLIGSSELPGVAMSIDADKVGEMASKLADLLDATSAAAALGIGRANLRALVAANVIAPDAAALSIGAGSLWARSDIETFVDAVSTDAPRLARAPSGCVPLPRACRDGSVSMSVVIRALLDGRIHAVARTSDSLSGVWLTMKEVRRLVLPRKGTIREAARELGIHYEAARWLTAEGHLGFASGMLDEAVVTAFAATFVTAAQAARVLNVSSRMAAARMRSAGYGPVFGPPSCRQEIWSRDALRAVGGSS